MRKASEPTLPEAMQFETIEASLRGEKAKGYYTGFLYAVTGKQGVYRRITRTAQGLRQSRPGTVLATFDGGIIELATYDVLHGELAEAGFTLPEGVKTLTLDKIPEDDGELFAGLDIVDGRERWEKLLAAAFVEFQNAGHDATRIATLAGQLENEVWPDGRGPENEASPKPPADPLPSELPHSTTVMPANTEAIPAAPKEPKGKSRGKPALSS